MLREDLSNERQRTTQLELELNDSESKAEDLQRSLTMTKKREDLLKNQVQELAYELEKVRDSEHSASFISNTSFQQNMVTELEMKVQSLQMQNETLREGNQETINAKYIELENKLLDVQKDNNKLT